MPLFRRAPKHAALFSTLPASHHWRHSSLYAKAGSGSTWDQSFSRPSRSGSGIALYALNALSSEITPRTTRL
jgi:hypothetical protein